MRIREETPIDAASIAIVEKGIAPTKEELLKGRLADGTEYFWALDRNGIWKRTAKKPGSSVLTMRSFEDPVKAARAWRMDLASSGRLEEAKIARQFEDILPESSLTSWENGQTDGLLDPDELARRLNDLVGPSDTPFD